MDIMLQIGILCGFAPLLIFFSILLRRAEDKKRLGEYLETANETQRPARKTKDILISLFKPFLPSAQVLEKMQFELKRARLNYTPEEIYAFRWTLAIVIGIMMAFIFFPAIDKMFLFGGATGMLCYLLPIRLVRQKVKHRQNGAQRETLDFIDLVANGMEAGLDLRSSIDKVTRQMPGVLAEEFQVAFGEIELGRRKVEAFKDMAQQLDVEDVTLLIDSINQAEKTGVPMARVLKDQAQRIRQNYKTNALKIAQAASIKMLAPMIIFIVPALFIVVLGPPFIGIGKLLKF